MAQHLENLHPCTYISTLSLSIFFPSIHLPYISVLFRPLSLPVQAVCSCCYALVLPAAPSPLAWAPVPGVPPPAQQDLLLTQQGSSCLLSLPPSLFLWLSCSPLHDLNVFWISSERRGWVQLSVWQRDSLPGITHPRVSHRNQRFHGKAGESKNNICSWRWSRYVSYLLILIHQFPHKFTHCSSLFLISSSMHPNSELFPLAHSLYHLPAMSLPV